jgi:rSAM/selenodomain-associated transferase 1
MSTGAIAVFVKTPGLSPVKTRLAKVLTTDSAEAFHWAAARAVSASIKATRPQTAVQGYYAVAEKSALDHSAWQDLPRLWQGEGGLGERMRQVYQILLAQHDFVMLVGADIPQMTAQQLSHAASWLAHDHQARFSFGPSVDGGFWLFGGNCPIPDRLWTDVAYSAIDTGAEFLSKIERLGEVQFAPSLRDVDEACDLIVLHETLQCMSCLLPEQRDLVHFLDTLPSPLFLHC